jgi:hypothetical protein
MTRAALLVAAVAVCAAAFGPATSLAQEYAPNPPFWAVTGVRSDDVLHLRDVPSAESKSLAGIPPSAHGLKNLGCRQNHPPLEQWMRMSQAQRELAATQWCRVEYQGKEGWVAARYLKKDERAGRAQ